MLSCQFHWFVSYASYDAYVPLNSYYTRKHVMLESYSYFNPTRRALGIQLPAYVLKREIGTANTINHSVL